MRPDGWWVREGKAGGGGGAVVGGGEGGGGGGGGGDDKTKRCRLHIFTVVVPRKSAGISYPRPCTVSQRVENQAHDIYLCEGVCPSFFHSTLRPHSRLATDSSPIKEHDWSSLG